MNKIQTLILLFSCFVFGLCAQSKDDNLYHLLATPHLDNIQGASQADVIVFTLNSEGKRNVFVAQGPNYHPDKLTSFDSDDAQEITNLKISSNGEWALFVRGGDHGGNSSPVPMNSASLIQPQNIEIYTIHLVTKKVRRIGLGDYPIFHPNGKDITFLRSGQVWSAPLDLSNDPHRLFTMRGSAGNISWSSDGHRLAFVSRRGDYSFVGIYTALQSRIQWIAPSFHTDTDPQWSPDNKQLAFLRRPATGGAIDSITANLITPWSILVYDFAGSNADTVYSAPHTIRASFPRIAGNVNLRWRHKKYITFTSYEDGWPHLYRIDVQSKRVNQLTKGDFTVDQVSYSQDANSIVFSANTGKDKYDFERMHIGKLELSTGKIKILTEGEGLESAPQFFNKDNAILFKHSSYNSPIRPKVWNMKQQKFTLVAEELIPTPKVDMVKPTQVFITSEDGIVQSAQLFKPKNVNSKLPALVYIHGGPRRQMYLGWHHIDYYFYDYAVNQHLASLGYAVLSVNYRQGTGYGYDFQHPKNAGSFGASEYLDIKAAGLWLKNQPDINPDKVGVFGGSYGGYLTAMALAKNSDIFCVGVDIHGVHTRERKQNPEYYAPDFDLATRLNWESSPSKYVDSWKSPVLIIHGDDDKNVDFKQSIDLYNRLKDKNVDVEILVLPDENHHWQLFENLIKVKKTTVDYLNRKMLNH